METGIEKAVRIAGSQTALAQLLGVRPQAVQRWVMQKCAPGGRCLSIEAALERRVSRYELNGKVFGAGPAHGEAAIAYGIDRKKEKA